MEQQHKGTIGMGVGEREYYEKHLNSIITEQMAHAAAIITVFPDGPRISSTLPRESLESILKMCLKAMAAKCVNTKCLKPSKYKGHCGTCITNYLAVTLGVAACVAGLTVMYMRSL